MKKPLILRNAALTAALAAVAATAWATNEYVSTTVYKDVDSDVTVTTPEPAAAPEQVAGETEATANETLAAPADAAPLPAPVAERSFAQQPPVTVEAPRMTLDPRIQADVMDRLASAPSISGKIGVESNGAVVTLTGYTVTAGQAYRAGRIAGAVEGVRHVQNEIRARIGGSV